MDSKVIAEEGKRIGAIMDYLKVNASTFEDTCGLARATVYKANHGTLTRETAMRICRKFPEISLAWVIAGEGEMFKAEDGNSGNIAASLDRLAAAIDRLCSIIEGKNALV